jgi:hypothetical protein
MGDRSAYDKKTSTSEGKEGLDGPFEPPREDPSRSANLQESWCTIYMIRKVCWFCVTANAIDILLMAQE